MKINRARLKEIIRSVMAEEKDYEQFFRSELEKAGFSSPAEMSDTEKREFFNKIDADWKAKNEELVGKQHKLDVDGDGDISGDDLAALRAGKKPVKEEKSKYYIEIDSPREIDSNRVKGEIKSLMKRGARSSEIGLRSNFLTTDPKDLMAKFQKVKNHVYFANDTRRFESVDEGVMKPGKKIRYVLGWAGENQPVKNDKYVIYQLVNNRYFSMRGISGGMTYLWKAIESTDPRIKVGSTEEIHPKQLKSGLKHGFYVMESVNESVNEATKFYAFFNGKKHEIEGTSLWDAKQKAITQLKVPKSKVGLLAVVNAAEHQRGSFQFEGLAPDVAKHMDKIHKGFVKVEGDGTMIYDSPATAKKAADILNKNKIAASTDGKYLYIEIKKSKR